MGHGPGPGRAHTETVKLNLNMILRLGPGQKIIISAGARAVIPVAPLQFTSLSTVLVLVIAVKVVPTWAAALEFAVWPSSSLPKRTLANRTSRVLLTVDKDQPARAAVAGLLMTSLSGYHRHGLANLNLSVTTEDSDKTKYSS